MQHKTQIDVHLVQCLVASQFPHWANLEIKPVEQSGWDNRTFRLGPHMTVRMPSHADYAEQVKKEQFWLPKLRPHLALPIPKPLARGMPEFGYPWSWSVYKWIDGYPASTKTILDLKKFAIRLAEFLCSLHKCSTVGGPPAGQHSFYRGGELLVYDGETRTAIASLSDYERAKKLTQIWNLALASTWQRPAVWVHGDIAIGNLLVNNGQLCAVIDFGQLCIGDPACDLVIAWTLFTKESRNAFFDGLKLDEATWVRARGWALWKALCWTFPGEKRIDWLVVNEVMADYEYSIKLLKKTS